MTPEQLIATLAENGVKLASTLERERAESAPYMARLTELEHRDACEKVAAALVAQGLHNGQSLIQLRDKIAADPSGLERAQAHLKAASYASDMDLVSPPVIGYPAQAQNGAGPVDHRREAEMREALALIHSSRPQ